MQFKRISARAKIKKRLFFLKFRERSWLSTRYNSKVIFLRSVWQTLNPTFKKFPHVGQSLNAIFELFFPRIHYPRDNFNYRRYCFFLGWANHLCWFHLHLVLQFLTKLNQKHGLEYVLKYFIYGCLLEIMCQNT